MASSVLYKCPAMPIDRYLVIALLPAQFHCVCENRVATPQGATGEVLDLYIYMYIGLELLTSLFMYVSIYVCMQAWMYVYVCMYSLV